MKTGKSQGPFALILVALFGLPFAAAGLFALYQAGQISGPLGKSLGLGAIGLVFSVLGLGLSLFYLWLSRQNSAMLARYPDQPWMLHKKWRDGRIFGSTRTAMLVAWMMTIVFGAFSIPLLTALPKELARGNHAILMTLMFPAATLGLLIWAVRTTQRFLRFGSAFLQLSTLPGIIGGRLEGTFELASDLRPEKGFDLKLACVRRTRNRHGDSTSHESVVWETLQTVPCSSIFIGPRGSQVPVSFVIPYDLPSSDVEHSRDMIIWRLQIRAQVPGVDFSELLEVPVFRTPDSSAEVVEEKLETPEIVGISADEFRIEGSEARIRGFGAAGREFEFGAARNKGVALSVTAVALLLGIMVGVSGSNGVPNMLQGLIGIVASLCAYASIVLWLRKTRIRVDAAGLSVRKRLLGVGRSHLIPVVQIEKIQIDMGMVGNGHQYYDICVHERHNGRTRKRKIAGSIADKRAAASIVEQMCVFLGR